MDRLLIGTYDQLLIDVIQSLHPEELFEGDWKLVRDREKFLEEIDSPSIQLVIMDYELLLNESLRVIQLLKTRKVKTLIVSGREGRVLVLNLFKAGVNGIVFKKEGQDEVVAAIQSLTRGKNYYSPKIWQIIKDNPDLVFTLPSLELSPVERNLILSIINGESTKQMADHLCISVRTAETYRNRLLKKLHQPNTAALVAFSFRNGIV